MGSMKCGAMRATRDIRSYALSQMERLGFNVREIQKAAAHTHEHRDNRGLYLNQHRERHSDARLLVLERPKT